MNKKEKICSNAQICEMNHGDTWGCKDRDGKCPFDADYDDLFINEEWLTFISRHDPNDGQQATAQKMGFKGLLKKEVVFSENPIQDLKDARITEKAIAVVAPAHVVVKLLNSGYTIIEFVNSPVKREKMVFCCEGAYKMSLASKKITQGIFSQTKRHNYFYAPKRGGIHQEYTSCPISIDEQYESSII